MMFAASPVKNSKNKVYDGKYEDHLAVSKMFLPFGDKRITLFKFDDSDSKVKKDYNWKCDIRFYDKESDKHLSKGISSGLDFLFNLRKHQAKIAHAMTENEDLDLMISDCIKLECNVFKSVFRCSIREIFKTNYPTTTSVASVDLPLDRVKSDVKFSTNGIVIYQEEFVSFIEALNKTPELLKFCFVKPNITSEECSDVGSNNKLTVVKFDTDEGNWLIVETMCPFHSEQTDHVLAYTENREYRRGLAKQKALDDMRAAAEIVENSKIGMVYTIAIMFRKGGYESRMPEVDFDKFEKTVLDPDFSMDASDIYGSALPDHPDYAGVHSFQHYQEIAHKRDVLRTVFLDYIQKPLQSFDEQLAGSTLATRILELVNK